MKRQVVIELKYLENDKEINCGQKIIYTLPKNRMSWLTILGYIEYALMKFKDEARVVVMHCYDGIFKHKIKTIRVRLK